MRIFTLLLLPETGVAMSAGSIGRHWRLRLLPCLGILLGLANGALFAAPKPPLASDYDLPAALEAIRDLSGPKRAEGLNTIAIALSTRGRFTDALAPLNEAVSLAEAAGDTAVQSRIQQTLSVVQQRREKLAESLAAAERGRALAFTTDDGTLKAKALYVLATAFVSLRDFDNSLRYSQEALTYVDAADQPRLRGQILNNIGMVYWQMGEFARSEDYLRQALATNPDQERFRYLLISNIGVALMEQGKLNEAGTYFKRSYDHFKSQADGYFLALLESNLADLAERLGQPKEALERCATALEMAAKLNNQYVRVRTYRHQGNALVDLGRVDEAEASYERSIEAAKVLRDPSEEMQTRSRLIKLYENTDRYKEALAANRATQAIREDILSKQVRYQGVFLEAKFESARKEQQIALLNQQRDLARVEAEREKLEAEKSTRELELLRSQRAAERTKHNLIGISLLIAILGLVVLYNRIRFQKRAYAQIAAQHKEIEAKQQELQQANAELHKLNEEKDEILGIAAHDLQTPLVAQRGFAELLRDSWQELPPEEVTEMTTSIASAADNMSEIIKNLLDSHRLERGALSIRPEPIDALPRLRDVISRMEASAEAKHQNLVFDLPQEFPLMDLDPIAFDRIVQNLLSNAMKYSPPFRSIHLSAAPITDHRFEIAIRDEGPGIPLEEQPRLFSKFARLSNRPTAGEASIGLGLSIVKQLVELHHGQIRCQSEPGQGSTFIISFPLSSTATSDSNDLGAKT